MRSNGQVCGHRAVTLHPTAIVDPEARLGEGVTIGPYAIVGPHVTIGDRTVIGAHAVIEGHTTLGAENEIFTGAVVGSRTQDKKFDGKVSYLVIGDRNRIREYVTMNPGTKEGTETRIGHDNLFMAYSHVAHDCIVHNHAILANQATLAGHVEVEDRAIIGGLSAVHQFVRIGRLSLVGGCSKVVQDIPPFMIVDGHPVRAFSINSVGLDRAGYPKEEKMKLKKAFKVLFRSGHSLKHAIAELETFEKPFSPCLAALLDFLKRSERGICG
ncbi:MAG: acyl-ACP--UDP-N-acetylglucosamine O-acyltransferase [Candidatus Omnitrophota bacterium]